MKLQAPGDSVSKLLIGLQLVAVARSVKAVSKATVAAAKNKNSSVISAKTPRLMVGFLLLWGEG